MDKFLKSFFLALNGIEITEKQSLLLLKSFEQFYTFFEDDIEPPSSSVALLTASCGMKFPQVLANSINCFGEKHFCFSDAAKLILDDYRVQNKKYPGFGHPKYKKEDPRVSALLQYAKDIKYNSVNLKSSVEFAQKIKLCLNFAGFIACVLLDCGCTVHTVDVFPIICRTVGIAKIYQRSFEYGIKFDSAYEIVKKYNR